LTGFSIIVFSHWSLVDWHDNFIVSLLNMWQELTHKNDSYSIKGDIEASSQ